MGCSTSTRVIAEHSSSKNRHHGKATKGLEKKDASLGTVDTNSQDGSIAESGTEDNAERMPSANEEINEQDTGEFAKKPATLSERDRQTSADILEELRMQGIIKTPSTTSQNRKVREEQQQKEFLFDTPKPIMSPESKTSEVQKTSNSFQLLPCLNQGKCNWMEKEEVDDTLKSCFQDFNTVESDVTYNTINEAF
ncbi:hypothetical protein lerEdw1_007106 [Lerista edwardsae]|nr:hypothetical protein lerEdw1_007106 [Lerista edwardsae]